MYSPFGIFTLDQRRNIALYIVGIMLYKFALEYFNGAFITMANDRFGNRAYSKIGILTGLNSAAQCIGSIVVAPLMKKRPTCTVLSFAVLTFGLISAILLIVDAASGGQLRFKTADKKTKYGKWSPNGLFPVYIISGIAYGMVELIRRVIPRDIVGGDVQKLRRMDAIVHVLYEVAGTIAAFTSTSLIGIFGYNNSYFLSPILFAMAGIVWRFIGTLGHDAAGKPVGEGLDDLERPEHHEGFFAQVAQGFKAFGKAFYVGMFIIFSHRRFVWLVSGYSFALYGHRFLENQIAPIFAKQVIGNPSYSQIMVGGSNFGELLGALSVVLFTNAVPTPIPWLRLDALFLQIVWILPYISVERGSAKSAWRIAGCFIPISFGWAAGDVSLAAFIQGTLARMESSDKDVSALGAVMAFLYVTYIVLYAILSSVLGGWVDDQLAAGRGARFALKYVAGVQFTILSAVVIASTFIPKGAVAFNPRQIDGSSTHADDDMDTLADPERTPEGGEAALKKDHNGSPSNEKAQPVVQA